MKKNPHGITKPTLLSSFREIVITDKQISNHVLLIKVQHYCGYITYFIWDTAKND